MQRVDVFIETSSRFRGNVERKCGYVLSTQLRNEEKTRKHFGRVSGTYHQAVLLTMTDALDHLTKGCDVYFHVSDLYVTSRLGKIREMADAGGLNAKGKPIANREEWRKVFNAMNQLPDAHKISAKTEKHSYSMSYVLRYIYEQAQIRRGKRNRLVYAIVCYADDFTIYGDVSKLKKAMKKATIWAHDKFGLKIKDIWQFYQVASFDEERENLEERRKGSKKRTPGVDMMGYVVRRRYTIIRGRVFRRIRRQVLRAWEDFKVKGFIPWWRACRIAAYKGWIKHSNSLKFRMEYCFDKLFKMCSYSASKHGKEVENEKRILLIAALSS